MANNLIGCPIKRTKKVDIGIGFINYIQSYNDDQDSHLDSIRPDIDQIREMRRSVESIISTSTSTSAQSPSSFGEGEGGEEDDDDEGEDGNGSDLDLLRFNQSHLNTLFRYYAHLTYISTKFPADIGVKFTYYPIFSNLTSLASNLIPGQLPSTSPIGLNNLQFERSSILFNIASISMSIGVSHPRSTIDQLKRAIGFFQQAAGCFSHLREKVVRSIDLPTGSQDPIIPSPDLSNNTLLALEYLSLAQAQECGWQSSVIGDKVKNSSVSKLAQEVSRLYQASLNSMKASKPNEGHWIGFSFPNDWIKFVNLKSAHFFAVAQYRKSCDDLTNHEHGIEVSRLQVACKVLNEALTKLRSTTHPESLVALKDSQGLMMKLKKTLESSRRDNDLIYLKEVPTQSQLPEIQPFSIVKPVVPQTVLNPLKFLSQSSSKPQPSSSFSAVEDVTSTTQSFGRRLFEFVVPYKIYRAKGLYEDRKREHLKNSIEALSESIDKEMIEALQSMNLPGSLEAIERPINPPPSILRNSAELRQLNASQVLSNLLANLEQVSSANCRALADISTSLNEEEERFNQLKAYYGIQTFQKQRGLRDSKDLNRVLREKEAQVLNALKSATMSGQILTRRFHSWFRVIELLCQDEDTIRKAIPKPNLPNLLDHGISTSSSIKKKKIKEEEEGELLELSDLRILRNLLEELDDLKSDRELILNSSRKFCSKDELRKDSFERLKIRLDSLKKKKNDSFKNSSLSSSSSSEIKSFGKSSSSIDGKFSLEVQGSSGDLIEEGEDKVYDDQRLVEEDELERFFEDEIFSKYSDFEERLISNQIKQETLILKIRKANEIFLNNRIKDPTVIARENLFKELDLGYHEYFGITKNLQEGLEFHRQFSKYIEPLRGEVKDYLMRRSSELDGIIKSLNRRSEKLKKQQQEEGEGEEEEEELGDDLKKIVSNLKIEDGEILKGSDKIKKINKGKMRDDGVGGSDGDGNRNGHGRPGVYDSQKHGPVKFIE